MKMIRSRWPVASVIDEWRRDPRHTKDSHAALILIFLTSSSRPTSILLFNFNNQKDC